MAWIEIVDEEQADGLLARVYEQARRRSGRVSQILKVSSLVPELIDGYIKLYVSMMLGRGALSRAEREMIAVVVSYENDCFY